jgi:hypothetical protein
MSAEVWEQTLGPPTSIALGAHACEAAYGSILSGYNQVLLSAIDDYARANGPGDDLLAQLAPAAKGDVIAVITVAGRLPAPSSQNADAGAARPSSPQAGGRRGGGGGGMGGMRGGGGGGRMASAMGTGEQSTLEMSASFYSVRERRSVGLIAMQYDGPSFEDAVTKFASKIAATLPRATCDGWNWDAPVDAQHIRDSIDR